MGQFLVLFLAYCSFVFIASFVGYFLNADRSSALARALFLIVPTVGVLVLGWAALAAFIPATIVGAVIFWRSPYRSFTDSVDVSTVRDEQLRAAPALASNGTSAESNLNRPTPEAVLAHDDIAKMIEESQQPGSSKTYSELLAEGHPHKGGLAQLAAAEQAGTLFGPTETPPPNSPATKIREVVPNEEDWNDPVLQYMRDHSIPITRENYLGLAYPDGLPDEWTAELEAHVPECIRSPLPAPDGDDVPMSCYTPLLAAFDQEFTAERGALMSRLLEDVRQLPQLKDQEDGR